MQPLAVTREEVAPLGRVGSRPLWLDGQGAEGTVGEALGLHAQSVVEAGAVVLPVQSPVP